MMTSNAPDRTVYFFVQNSPLQFKICSIVQLSVDFGEHKTPCTCYMLHAGVSVIIGQRLYFGNAIPASALLAEDDIEQALVLAEE